MSASKKSWQGYHGSYFRGNDPPRFPIRNHPPIAMDELRIFVSSLGDVAEERALTVRVLGRLAGEFSRRTRLKPIFWEHEPLLATSTFRIRSYRHRRQTLLYASFGRDWEPDCQHSSTEPMALLMPKAPSMNLRSRWRRIRRMESPISWSIARLQMQWLIYRTS